MRRRRTYFYYSGKDDQRHCTIRLTRNQVNLIDTAVEEYVGQRIGNFSGIRYALINWVFDFVPESKHAEAKEKVEKYLEDLVQFVFPTAPHLTDEKLDDSVRALWDIHQVLAPYSYTSTVRTSKESELPQIEERAHTWENFLEDIRWELKKFGDGLQEKFEAAPEHTKKAALEAASLLEKGMRKRRRKSSTSTEETSE